MTRRRAPTPVSRSGTGEARSAGSTRRCRAGGDDRAGAWQTQRDTLRHRWSASAYSIIRASGDAGLAATPVLGGGQSGAAIAWTPDPLSAHPLALTARAETAHDDTRSAFAAVGVAWHPVRGATIAAERLIPIGSATHGDWAVRVAAGAATSGPIGASAYGEAGVVGTTAYAAVQGRTGVDLRVSDVTVSPGGGGWASVQRGHHRTIDRFDLGPGVTFRAGRFSLAAEYRFRIAGNAAPRSGPVVTLSAAF